MRKGSKVKVNKVKSKELVQQFFVVFLKCTLERRLEGFQHYWIIFWYKTVPKVPLLLNLFGVDAKYAKYLCVFGEMCVVADTDNKVGRTKIDPRGKISIFVGYSTQHAGDVYRLLNPKTSWVIHSRDVKWIGKTRAEFYEIKMIYRASGFVD